MSFESILDWLSRSRAALLLQLVTQPIPVHMETCAYIKGAMLKNSIEAEHQVAAVNSAHDTSPNVSLFPNDFELMGWAADTQMRSSVKTMVS